MKILNQKTQQKQTESTGAGDQHDDNCDVNDDARRLISKSEDLIIIDNDEDQPSSESIVAVVTKEPTSSSAKPLSLTRKHISSSPYRVRNFVRIHQSMSIFSRLYPGPNP